MNLVFTRKRKWLFSLWYCICWCFGRIL